MNDQALFRGEPCYDILAANMKPELSFDKGNNTAAWRHSLKEKLLGLMGMPEIEKNKAPALNLQIKSEEKGQGYTRINFTVESEIDCHVPCSLFIPDTGKEKYPVAVILRGHVAEAGYRGEYYALKDSAEQLTLSRGEEAVKNGYIALCVEERGTGARAPRTRYKNTPGCLYVGMVAIMLGRTIVGERIFDLQRALDALCHFPQCNIAEVLVTGHASGATTAYYAACCDERIKLCVCSNGFAPYGTSVLDRMHCHCNVIPAAYQYFDMPDLSALIAPRPLAVIAGALDDFSPIEGVREGFGTVRAIFEAQNAPNACRLVETETKKEWCTDTVWGTVNAEAEKLGWK